MLYHGNTEIYNLTIYSLGRDLMCVTIVVLSILRNVTPF